ncbi:chemotaxis protein CheD [Herbaspirillum sp. RV1423]|uniref:chemotaxis protein CheD n=1 Tax=Herbaspirillum sp. RV1423 TaxID=1443993 RepID=UPI0004B108F4|nr:chemotaxis protein CheD [Herbaspirillum sp. RV1423]
MTRRVFVNLGEVYFGCGDLQVETLLGSCVAITFWHPGRRLGGLCHFLLPERLRPPLQGVEQDTPDGRYGDQALSQLLDQVQRHDTRIADYAVKVFGGGNVLDLPTIRTRVGQANVDFALEILQRRQIKITAQDVAGDGYRYLRFDLNNGDVWVRRGHGVSHGMEKVPAVRKQHGDKALLDKEPS